MPSAEKNTSTFQRKQEQWVRRLTGSLRNTPASMMLDFLGNREKDKALKEAAAAIETTVIKVTREKIKSPQVSVIDS